MKVECFNVWKFGCVCVRLLMRNALTVCVFNKQGILGFHVMHMTSSINLSLQMSLEEKCEENMMGPRLMTMTNSVSNSSSCLLR